MKIIEKEDSRLQYLQEQMTFKEILIKGLGENYTSAISLTIVVFKGSLLMSS